MTDIYGFVSWTDIESLRKLAVKANLIEIEDIEESEGIDPSSKYNSVKTVSSAKKGKKKDGDEDWPDLFDEENEDNPESLLDDADLNKDEEDLVANGPAEMIIKVYYKKTKDAQIPFYVDLNSFVPDKYRYERTHVLIKYHMDDL